MKRKAEIGTSQVVMAIIAVIVIVILIMIAFRSKNDMVGTTQDIAGILG